MNIKLVLSTYSKLRQLTDDETALLETLRRLNDSEREALVTTMQPQKPTTKKAGKKASKSTRATGMQAQLNKNMAQQRQAKDDGACTYVLENGSVCNTGDSNPIHDKSFGYTGYHPFTGSAKDNNYQAQTAVGGSNE